MTEKKVILIIGKRGSGKSYLANRLLADRDRIFIYDCMGDFQQGVLFEYNQFAELSKFWKSCYKNQFRIIYRPLWPAPQLQVPAGLAWQLGNLCFVIEEAAECCQPHQVTENLAKLVRMGRHRNIEVVAITQRPYELDIMFRSQAKEIYVFNTTEPRDRDWLRKVVGAEVENKLDQLKQYEHITWQDGQDQLNISKA